MEEAEALCDRLGIFVQGKLKAIGAPAEVNKTVQNRIEDNTYFSHMFL
jgi:ABC-type multidrug transport system ATPase subunit